MMSHDPAALAEGRLLRLFIGESDRHEGMPLDERDRAQKAREHGWPRRRPSCAASKDSARTAACTLAKILRLSTDLPIVVEIVDARRRSTRSWPLSISAPYARGLATLENAEIRFYRSGAEPR